MQKITGGFGNLVYDGQVAAGGGTSAEGAFYRDSSYGGAWYLDSGVSAGSSDGFRFDPSRVARTSTETRSASTRTLPVILV